MKKVLVFGSTGSIGRNALTIISQAKDEFKVSGLCCQRNSEELFEQVKTFRPAYVCIADPAEAKKVKIRLSRGIKLFCGPQGLAEFSTLDSDISLMAISGISCLRPLLTNMAHTKRVALANKESLVTAGSLVFRQSRKHNTQIIPVDSEINALFQLFGLNSNSERPKANIRKVYLTASGGALAGYQKKDLAKVGVKQVLAHPTWKMGRRITVDSATLVNKGFEIIETHFFFGLPFEKIGIILHCESAIHAFIEHSDGALFACVYSPDMKIPISFALYYPRRYNAAGPVDFKTSFSYSFKPFDSERYPLLKLILAAAKRADNALVVLNACDEIAIDYFLNHKIKFTDIAKVMDYLFSCYPRHKINDINDIFFWDDWSRAKTKEYLAKL